MTTALKESFGFFCDAQLVSSLNNTALMFPEISVIQYFTTFQLQTVWLHHCSNLHNRKKSISPKRKKIFQKEKCHYSVVWKAFQISRKYFQVICTLHRIVIILKDFQYWNKYQNSVNRSGQNPTLFLWKLLRVLFPKTDGITLGKAHALVPYTQLTDASSWDT